MTFWDFLANVLDTWPVALLVLIVVAWLGWGLLLGVLRWQSARPQVDAGDDQRRDVEEELREAMRRLCADQFKQIERMKEQADDLERRLGGHLVMIRELDAAFYECAKECPRCGEIYGKAIDNAVKRMQELGLKRHELPPLMQERSATDG